LNSGLGGAIIQLVMAVPGEGFPRRFGRYLLLKRMAIGGMAEVLLAVEETGHGGRRFVTIKRIRAEHAGDPDFVEFFLTEGRVSLKCSHPNLPQAFDLGVVGQEHYLSLEFIRGHTLLDLIRASRHEKRPLSTPTILRVAIEVAAALEHVHALCDVDGRPLGVVHRDVNPQNVMIAASGAVKLIDFGIVRSALQTHRTQNGVVKGKMSYIAPELLDGRGRFDRRADIFSFGAMLHESVTGRSLFRGRDDAETAERLRQLEIPDPTGLRPDVPAALSDVIFKALERHPEHRFQSATEILAALEQVAEVASVHHSVTRLREEVLSLCGRPPLPTLSREVLEALGREEAAAAGMDAGADPGDEPDTMKLPTRIPPPEVASGSDTDVDPPEPLDGRLARDPRLVYFLEKAGAARKGPPPRRQTAHDDPDYVELLSLLER
jgi:eukaryotic-like serine/threonine-protein kinase